MDTKLVIDKLGQKPRYNPGGTSALSMLRSNSKPLSSAVQSNQHSSQLTLAESDKQIMKITPFGMRNPTLCPTASTQLNVQTMENDVIRLHVNVVEHLPNELKVVDIPREIQFQELTNHWKKPGVLIGADHFLKFIKLQNVQELSSGHMLVQSKVGPMIAGSGDNQKIFGD
ncbi:hypothetical protein LOAG_18912 [Loa loa]|uniref:DUF1758 domain-containing protein n=1 Tax=Loa loa TaxID=7209 RepID=A0A1S0UE27_LOALO|nr:hypothetical protein LOAG_18912 [Loa loa]EJD73676.1 hypothetical protein LOAG_18912 [Loa loa]